MRACYMDRHMKVLQDGKCLLKIIYVVLENIYCILARYSGRLCTHVGVC